MHVVWVVIPFYFLQSHSVLFRSKNKDEQIRGAKGNMDICPFWLSSHPFLLGSCPKQQDAQQCSPLLVCTPSYTYGPLSTNSSCLDWCGGSQLPWLCWAATAQSLGALWKAREPCTLVSLRAEEGLGGLNLSVKQDCHMGDRSESVRTH